LIELMIVLVIMSFVLALAGPAVTRGLSGLTLKTAAKKVAAALRYARSQAVSRSQPYSVIFDRDNNRVVIRGIPQPLTPDQTEAAEEDPGREAESAAEAAKKKPEIKVVSLPEGITLTEITVGGKEITATKEELAQMVFYSDGTSQGGELVLADSRDRKFRVRVAFLTGVVTLEEQES
jgi:general secretion pathway protein H